MSTPQATTTNGAEAPADLLRRDLMAGYAELAHIEQLLADLRVDLDAQRRRVAQLEHAALGLGQQ